MSKGLSSSGDLTTFDLAKPSSPHFLITK
jgi:hypothetical protein